MNIVLSQRMRVVAVALVTALVLFLITICTVLFRSRVTLISQASALKSNLEALTNERDSKAAALAPFELLAGQQFTSQAPENRLPLLLERIKGVTEVAQLQGRRHLDPEAVVRIRAKLDATPGLDVEVGGLTQDAESLALAEELRSLFESSGGKTRKLAQYVPSKNIPAGVTVYSKHELDHVLGDAVGQMFAELEQHPSQWLENDPGPPRKLGDTEPDLKIVVGRR